MTAWDASFGVSRRRERGSVYILVLGVSLLVTVLGVSALMAVRVERDRSTLDRDAQQARRIAESAIDLAMLKISTDANWRTTYTHNVWVGPQAFGNGTFDWKPVDPDDTDLADDETQRVKLVAAAILRDARQLTQVTIQPPAGGQIDALDYVVRVGGTLSIDLDKSLTATGGAGVSADTVNNTGTLFGNVTAGVFQILGLLGGTSTVAPPPDPPSPTVVDDYVAIATPLPFSGDIDRMVVAPGRNDYSNGATNPDGVYYINTGNQNFTIRSSRIHGTLIIDGGAGKVVISKEVFMHPNREDYPTLIVRAERVDMEFTSNGSIDKRYLREVDHTKNFNPSGAAYQGVSDTDQSDVYPSEIQGLVHIISVEVNWKSGRIRGSLLVEGNLAITGHPEAVYSLNPETPIVGYTQPGAGPMTVVPGSWQRVVE